MRSVHVLGKSVEREALRLVRVTGEIPTRIKISPSLYRRLLEMICREQAVGGFLIGSRPVNVVETSVGQLALVIDEALRGKTFFLDIGKAPESTMCEQ